MANFGNPMTSDPHRVHNGKLSHASDDEIVISGLSGIYPSSRNIKEFEYNLYNKISMVNDDESRWAHIDPSVPRYSGKIPDLKFFDAPFFGVHQLQADHMDPQNRLLIEEAYKAVMDAGVNPSSLKGSNTGVYVGSCFSESENFLYYNLQIPSGFGITGCSKAMFANRISYTLGLTGPSMLCDTACSSSMYALDLAYHALANGEIDAAIVGGANLCLHPTVSMNFNQLGVLSPDGCSRPFDANANGYIRSEAIGCLFLQRRVYAKRIYATIVYSLSNCDGFKPEGVTYPSSVVQEKLLRQVYVKAKIDPNELGFMEAHATGTVVGDPEECKAIHNAICTKRLGPLLVGSVKSNCGHAEPASALCSLAKVIFAMQSNIIPPNINFKKLRSEIPALNEGRLKVVSEPTKLPKPYVGVNSFGFGGANAHVILKQFEKSRTTKQQTSSDLPRLVTWSSRTEENALAFLTDLENKPLDEEYLALAQNAQSGGIQGMVFRGYSILKSTSLHSQPTALNKSVQHNGGIKRPLVWVFSGMGSQWVGMGKSLMQLPLFSLSIQRSHNTLKATGLNLINIITSEDPKMFENIIHSFVGIAAIQIALVDILNELDISPDFVIGHSVGELGCAYADKCFTAEQMILAAYYRGKVSLEIEKIKGSMAAVGMGYRDIKLILPETIEVACHNSTDSCTISGPCAHIANFVSELKSKNIFAKEVPCSNIAYHSRYIAQLGPELLKYLKHIVPNPKARSNKWISTSVPKNKWLQDASKYSSAEYHTNNLLNSVLFEEATAFIPKNALTIEVAPHALLQSILKNAFGDGVHIGLTRRGAQDSVLFFLNALGSLFINGIELNIAKLYPEIQFPVCRGTPSLSHLIDFDHSREYYVYKYKDHATKDGILSLSVALSDKYQYLAGHEIDGRVLAPATFYLEAVWRTFAASKGVASFETLPVEFENVKLIRATTLNAKNLVELLIVIQKGTGKFEVTESQSLVATGFIRDLLGKTKPYHTTGPKEYTPIKKKDFYKELKLRGYHYNDEFQGVEMASIDGSYGKIKWTQNWVTFLDCMLQVKILAEDTRDLLLPTKIRLLRIYSQYHQTVTEINSTLEVYSNNVQNRITCGGVEIIGLSANTVPRRRVTADPVLERYQFIPHFPAPKLSTDDVARCCIQLVLENTLKASINIAELEAAGEMCSIVDSLKKAVKDLPATTFHFILHHKSEAIATNETESSMHIYSLDELRLTAGNIAVLTSDAVDSLESTFLQYLESNVYVIIREKRAILIQEYTPPRGFSYLAFFPTDSETVILLRRTDPHKSANNMKFLKISSADKNFQWVQKLQKMCRTLHNITLIAQDDNPNGIIGLVNCLRKEPATSEIKCIFIDDPQAPEFEKNISFYEKQLELGLAINIYRKGNWGTYRHLLLPQEYPTSAHSRSVCGDILHIGDFSSFRWFSSPLTNNNSAIKVVYSSLNFRDVMVASGRLSTRIFGANRINQASVFGFEYSGVRLKTGRRIMGIVAKSAVASHLEEESLLTWNIPESWSLREAATVPVVYLTVYYAFFFTTDIRQGKNILIHAGSGGVGIAAIRVALAYGLEVFTTVSSTEKKKFLLKTFPALKENHIGNSRDTSFEDMIIEQTEGKGVDFVLNSLSEDKLKASVRCLGRRGHFLEIGKYDMANDNSLGLGAFLNELSFHAVMADNLLTAEHDLVKNLKHHIRNDIESGIIQPLPSTVFKACEIEQAFRYLAGGKHIGKVMIQMREPLESETTLPISVLPKVYFSPELVYVVLGGLGGFGLELVDWMILRGARKIVLSSSRSISNDYQNLRISLWKVYSCTISINTDDIKSSKGCLDLLTDAAKLGPVGGIFNLAVVLKDSIFFNQSPERFHDAFAPKVFATKYLDEISSQICPKLQHFVIFSSISCGRGNAGQSNYGMANSIMERIIEDRVARGLPGKAVQWGAVGEVGLVAEMVAGKIDLEIGGTLQQRISSCLEVLDVLLSSPDPIVASMIVAENKGESLNQSPFEFILNTMSIRDMKSVSMNSTLSELGMDSLMSVEIKQIFERDYDIIFNSSDLRSLTFAKLLELSEKYAKGTNDTKAPQNVHNIDTFRLLYSYLGKSWMNTNTFDRANNLTQGSPLIIFPGLVGCSDEIWKKIANQLKFPAYVLQINRNSAMRTMNDIVQQTYQDVFEFLKKKHMKNFRIVAYSFGAMLAHRSVELLERVGYQGSVVLIDGSPNFMETLMSVMKNSYTEGDFDRMALASILNVLVEGISVQTIENDLREKFFKEDWLQYIRDTLQKHNFVNINSMLHFVEAMLMRLKVLQQPETYESIGVIQAKVLLIKPSIPTISNYDEYYGLIPFTRNDIQTEIVKGNHHSILQDDKLPGIINKFFS